MSTVRRVWRHLRGLRGSGVARGSLLFAERHVDARQHRGTRDEEEDHREDGGAARAEERDRGSENGGPRNTGELLEHGEEAEELRRLVLRDHAREERPAERL